MIGEMGGASDKSLSRGLMLGVWGQIHPRDISFLTYSIFYENLPTFDNQEISHMHIQTHPITPV